MKIFKSILVLTALMFQLTASAQDIKVIAKYIVSDARINKHDATKQYIDAGAYFAIYTADGKSQPYLSSMMSKANSQSYGPIYNLESSDLPETDKEYQRKKLTFKWSFSNSYDKEKGTADVTLFIINKPAGHAFEMTILTEKLDLLVYRGYVEGSLKDIN